MSIGLDWTTIDRVGEMLGVSYRARQKWRLRNHVPHKYRIPIILATGGGINAHVFAEMDRRVIPGNSGKRKAAKNKSK